MTPCLLISCQTCGRGRSWFRIPPVAEVYQRQFSVPSFGDGQWVPA